jgi:hypothetical protein
VARYVNELVGRSGRFWADRWFGRELRTPREVRHALNIATGGTSGAGGTGVLHNFALRITLHMCPPAKQRLGWANMRVKEGRSGLVAARVPLLPPTHMMVTDD